MILSLVIQAMAVVKALPDPSGVAQVVNPPLPGAPKVGSIVETAFPWHVNFHFPPRLNQCRFQSVWMGRMSTWPSMR